MHGKRFFNNTFNQLLFVTKNTIKKSLSIFIHQFYLLMKRIKFEQEITKHYIWLSTKKDHVPFL